MNNNILKPDTQNKSGKTLFYIFEIAALVMFIIFFIVAIVAAALASSFLTFVQFFSMGIFFLFVFYGIGKVLDLMYAKNEKGCDCGSECDCHKDKENLD